MGMFQCVGIQNGWKSFKTTFQEKQIVCLPDKIVKNPKWWALFIWYTSLRMAADEESYKMSQQSYDVMSHL